MSTHDHPDDDATQLANGNGTTEGAPSDPRILRIAAAIGRQIAREQIRLRRPANDEGHGRSE